MRVQVLNQCFDRRALPQVRVLNRSLSAFQFWLLLGSLIAIATTMRVAIRFGLSVIVMAAITTTALLTSLTLAMTFKIVTGEERYVYYHTAIAVTAVTTLLLWVFGYPVLQYLDLTVLGIGIVSVTGRIGCFMVGCCHGRPSEWGVCYKQQHGDVGFASYYIGVRLVPVQLIESLFVLLVISVAAIFVLQAKSPGAFLSWYVISYGLGRFVLEFLRGDPQRPYALGYSEAQWTSLVLIGLVVGVEGVGLLPLHIWHFIVAVGLLIAMVVVALQRRRQDKTTSQFHHPRHVQELATAIEFATNHAHEMLPPFFPPRGSIAQEIYIACTELGIQISASRIKYTAVPTYHYALSLRDGRMTEKTAKLVAHLILILRCAAGPSQFVPGKDGVFHLLFCAPGAKEFSR